MGEAEHAWSDWLDRGCVGPEPSLPLDPVTKTMQYLFWRQMAGPRSRAGL